MSGSSSAVTTTTPRVGDGVAPAILLRVVADERAARDEHVAVDDRAPDARVPADAHARHQDALLDRGRSCGRARSGTARCREMRLPETMQPGEMTESSAWPQRLPASANTNFAGGACGW